MKPVDNPSSQLRVGRYLLSKFQASLYPEISRTEVMEACGVKEKKRIGTIFRVDYRGMFTIEDGNIYPNYWGFEEGRVGFLEHLDLCVRALENSGNRESRAGNSAVESGFHRSSFGRTRRRI